MQKWFETIAKKSFPSNRLSITWVHEYKFRHGIPIRVSNRGVTKTRVGEIVGERKNSTFIRARGLCFETSASSVFPAYDRTFRPRVNAAKQDDVDISRSGRGLKLCAATMGLVL